MVKITDLNFSPSLLLRVRIFSDQREVDQRIGEVLIGHGGVWEHAGPGMALPDGAGAFLIGFEAQDFGVPQIGRRRIQLVDKRGSVGFQPRSSPDIPIDAMTVVANAFPVKYLSSPHHIAF